MKTKVIFLTAAVITVFGMAGESMAQSEAMKETYKANEKQLEKDVKAEDTGYVNRNVGSGHSEASKKSLNAIGEGTNKRTDIEPNDEMKALDAEGESEAKKQQ